MNPRYPRFGTRSPAALALSGSLLLSLILVASGPSRAADTPDFLYEDATSSQNPITIMGVSATSVLVKESAAEGDTLRLCPFDGATPLIVARAGGPAPGGVWPLNTRFDQAAVNVNNDILYRAFLPVDAANWEVATAFYKGAAQQSSLLQSFVKVPGAVKGALDQPIDLNGTNSVRLTALIDGSSVYLRSLDISNGATAIVAGTGNTIHTGMGDDTIAGFGPIRVTPKNQVVADVRTGRGSDAVLSFRQGSSGAWQETGYGPLPEGYHVKQIVLCPSDPNVVLALAQGPAGSQLFSVGLGASDSAAAPVSAAKGWGLGVGLDAITDLDRHGNLFGSWANETIAQVTLDSSLSVINAITPVFQTGQDTPKGPATGVGGGGLGITGNGSALFPIRVGDIHAITGAIPIPVPRGPVRIASASELAYAAGGVTYPSWLFSGPGGAGFVPPIPRPDGTALWSWYGYVVPESYLEQDGTPWSLQWDTVGPSTEQFTIPSDHFGPLRGDVSLNVGLTVGQTGLPRANVNGTGQLDLLSGKATFAAAGSQVLAANIFRNGDQMLWRDLGLQLPVGPLYDDGLDMPVAPPNPPAGGGNAAAAPAWIGKHDLHLAVRKVSVLDFDANNKLSGYDRDPAVERDTNGNVSAIRLKEPGTTAGHVYLLRVEFDGVDPSFTHLAHGAHVDLSTPAGSGTFVGVLNPNPVAGIVNPADFTDRKDLGNLGPLARALRDRTSPNQGVLTKHELNPAYTRGVLFWNVETLRGKDLMLTLIADCTDKDDHQSITVTVSGPSKN